MEFARYLPRPAEVTKELLEKYAKTRSKDED